VTRNDFTGTGLLWHLQLVAKTQLEVGGEGRNRTSPTQGLGAEFCAAEKRLKGVSVRQAFSRSWEDECHDSGPMHNQYYNTRNRRVYGVTKCAFAAAKETHPGLRWCFYQCSSSNLCDSLLRFEIQNRLLFIAEAVF
jgi:hypothetical protein